MNKEVKFLKDFGDRLKEIRLNKGLSQEEFATLLSTSKQVISRYETKQRTPKITVVNEYAKILNLSLEYLLGETDSESENKNSSNSKEKEPSQRQSDNKELEKIYTILNDFSDEQLKMAAKLLVALSDSEDNKNQI